MSLGLFRVRLADGSTRLARGDLATGPDELLSVAWSIDRVLAASGNALQDALSSPGEEPATGTRVLAPIESQEVWAAGVTYARSRDARMDELAEPSIYDRVYDADRPELFFKSAGWRVRGPGETVGIRSDSAWNVPEPELALVINADGQIVGHTIGNDMSSRTIEGENPLYLPQAKTYQHSCALGPAILPASAASAAAEVRLEIERDGTVVLRDATTSGRLKRSPGDLVGYLTRALQFPMGAVLLTGTGIVPPSDFTLQEDDLVRIEIEGLGRLENRVVVVGRS